MTARYEPTTIWGYCSGEPERLFLSAATPGDILLCSVLSHQRVVDIEGWNFVESRAEPDGCFRTLYRRFATGHDVIDFSVFTGAVHASVHAYSNEAPR